MGGGDNISLYYVSMLLFMQCHVVTRGLTTRPTLSLSERTNCISALLKRFSGNCVGPEQRYSGLVEM